MIETKPIRYFQIRGDDGVVLPAIELEESVVEASILWSEKVTPETALHLLLEDEAAGIFYVEVDLPGPHLPRIRVMLEDAPLGFVETVQEHGIALCPLNAGEGDRIRYLTTSPFG